MRRRAISAAPSEAGAPSAEFKDAMEAAAPTLPASRLLYSPNRAAEALDVSRSTLYGLMRDGRLRFVMIGNDRRIPAAELERLARDGTGDRAKEGGP